MIHFLFSAPLPPGEGVSHERGTTSGTRTKKKKVLTRPPKAAGIPRLYAPTIGIAVDGRRQNLSEESLAANVARLKAYKERLVVFPRRSNKPKQGDSKVDLSKTETVRNTSASFPFEQVVAGFSEVSKSDVPKPIEGGAYRKLRDERAAARNQGKKEKRARDAAEAEAAKK